ncbi:hypothetical protein [Sphingobacterium sp. MYb382]|uniref:hypothetical protein n=1 Tax=Sphingobacterium sp. MYb382 TaxID=2745278 RepID=UPI0030A376E8
MLLILGRFGFHQVNEQLEVMLYKLEYNEIGQLKRKLLGWENGSFLTDIAYRYNGRGWRVSSGSSEFSQGAAL